MVLLEKEEFDFIYERLNRKEDVSLLHMRMGLPEDMLFNILARKVVRNVMRSYYKVKPKSKYYLREWRKGTSIQAMADSIGFSSVILSKFIMGEMGMTKKEINAMLINPDSARDRRLRDDLKEAAEKDFVYSPWATEMQGKNGKKAEGEINKWLTGRSIGFMTEYENKALSNERGTTYGKTPDFLLKKPMKVDGRKYNWVESKASFGDKQEMMKDYKKQFKPYVDLFGPGIVAYWYGYIKDTELDPEIRIVEEEFFR